MKFDEAIDKTRELSMDGTQPIDTYDVIQIINDLRAKYVPTVEMTSRQKEILLQMKNNKYNKFSLIEIIGEFDDGELIKDFDEFWYPLTEIQVVQAWLHPETIKVVDKNEI